MLRSSPWLLGLCLLLGCPTAPEALPSDDDDSAVEDPCPEAPPPSNPCLAGCGNELGVGYPCVRGEGQCSTSPNAVSLFCTADFNQETDLAFCTGPCVVDEDCGTDAICTGDPDSPASGRGCFPLSCWTPPVWETHQLSPANR